MTPEGRITAGIINRLKAMKRAGQPVWWVKIAGGPRQRAGLPDLLVCCRGRWVFFEIKAPGGKPSKLQDATIEEIQAAQGRALVVWDVEIAMAEVSRAFTGES